MSDAYSFGSSDDDTIGPPTPLKKFRSKYYEELAQKPQVYRKLMALTQAEVGNQGPEAQQAFLETVFNRAASRGQTLDEAMQLVSKGGYYPGLGDYNKVSAETQTGYGDLLNQVRSGSNVGNYATGNASGTVGFNKGPQVAEYGGERYGIEGPDLKTMQGIAGGTIDPLEASTFDPTGRKRMANGDSSGILPLLGMQNQQPQGLLGALGDPETMAYIGMMLKGLSPYSNIDPNAMLSSAHTNALRKQALQQQLAEQTIDNRRADEALKLRRQEYGDARTERQAREADRMRLKQEAADLAASQRKRDAEAFSDLSSAPDAAAPDAAAPFAPSSNDDKIAKIDQRLAQGGLSDAGEKQLLRLREQYSKGPSATQLNILKKDEDAIPVYDDIGRKLDRALELAPKVSTGLKASAETTFGPILGGLAPQQTQDTINFRNITSQFAIENMSQTMKGATSDKEMFKNLSIAADERNSIEIRTEALKRAKDRNDQLKELAATRKKQIEEGTYGRKQPAKSEPSGGKTRLRFNPETGDFE